MRQAIALLVTAGLVVGGLVGGDVIGAETTPESQPPEAATAAAPSPGDAEAPRKPKREAAEQKRQRPDRGGQQAGQSFCAVSQQLQRAGRRAFGDLETRENPPAAKIRKAERRFATQNRRLLGEAQQVAPRPIQSEVKALVAATRARAGRPGQAPSRQKARAAERRVSDFERRNCRSR